MDYNIEKVEVYKIGDKTFNTREEANKHIAFMKNDKILKHANSKSMSKSSRLLKELIEQGLTNKNKILNVIKHLEEHGC